MLIAKPCTSMKAINITPEERYDIDLEELCECLAEKGYQIKKVTRFLALVKKTYDISLFPSGKIIVKDTDDKGEALKIAQEIYECIGKYKVG
jgi:ArsR family metal-binding transcriptional regulator